MRDLSRGGSTEVPSDVSSVAGLSRHSSNRADPCRAMNAASCSTACASSRAPSVPRSVSQARKQISAASVASFGSHPVIPAIVASFPPTAMSAKRRAALRTCTPSPPANDGGSSAAHLLRLVVARGRSEGPGRVRKGAPAFCLKASKDGRSAEVARALSRVVPPILSCTAFHTR